MSPSTKEYSDRKYKNNICCKNQRLRFALDIVRLTVLLCELTVKFITTAVSIPVNHALLMPNDTTEQQNNFTSSYLVNSKKSRITSKKNNKCRKRQTRYCSITFIISHTANTHDSNSDTNFGTTVYIIFLISRRYRQFEL